MDMDTLCRKNLIVCRDAYLAAQGGSASYLGKQVAADGAFFTKLEREDPATVTARKYDSVMDWFAGHWPEGCDSPDCLADHIALRQWEAANSYSCALASGDPVPRVMVPPICRSVGAGASGLSGLTVETAEGV